MEGQIQLILGSMFSGKTTELIRRIRRYNCAKKRCLLIKYRADTRYNEDSASTHDQQKETAVAAEQLEEVYDQSISFDVLGIDEGQFFVDIVPFAENMANRGKIVVIAALDGTFQRKPFGTILDLIPLAEKVTKLSAICMLCSKDASFSKRIGEEKQLQVIGGADKYLALCRSCFFLPK